VDFSFDNDSYTSYGTVASWNSGINRSIYYSTRSDYGDPREWHDAWPSGNTSTYVPRLWLGINGQSVSAGLPREFNIDSDPGLVADRWRLTAESACIDAGEAWHAPGSDIEGELRDALVDMGADEWVDTDSDGLSDRWEQFYFGDLSHTGGADDDSDELTNQGEYVHGANPHVSDTDGDGLADGEEVHTHGTNPINPDTDNDEMIDSWEITYGLDPLDVNTFDDPDGDQIPNLYEYIYQTVPTNVLSLPAPTLIVTNGAGVSLQQAVSDAISVATNGYPMLKVLSGLYTNSADRNITLNTPDILLYTDGGFERVVIDSQQDGRALTITSGRPVISGFVIQNGYYSSGAGIYVNSPSSPLIVNCVLMDNYSTGRGGGLYVESSADPVVQNCTLINNTAASYGGGIYDNYSRSVIRNTILWGNQADDGSQIYGSPAVTWSCIGGGYDGMSNIVVDPQLVPKSWRLTIDSPCIAGGETLHAPSIDIEGEVRGAFIDIGADEWMDSDGDSLADGWEQFYFGDLSHSAEADEDDVPDGLTNLQEYYMGTDPSLGDSDTDGLNDYEESELYNTNWLGTDPLNPDTDGDDVLDGIERNIDSDPLDPNSHLLEMPISFTPMTFNPETDNTALSFHVNGTNLVEITIHPVTYATAFMGGSMDVAIHTSVLWRSSVVYQPGDHTVHWDGRDESGELLAAALYIYKVAVSNEMGVSFVYDPPYSNGNVGWTTLENVTISTNYNFQANEPCLISYTLSQPAFVAMAVPNTAAAVIWGEPRSVGTHQELFDGYIRDPSRQTFELYEGAFTISASTYPLPENSLILENEPIVEEVQSGSYIIQPTYAEISSIEYRLNRVADVEVQIRDPDGNLITIQQTATNLAANVLHQVEWAGQYDDADQSLAHITGDYEAMIHATAGGKTETKSANISVWK